MTFPKKFGTLLLAIWLILHGLSIVIKQLNFEGMPMLMGILALAAGILILLDR
jgi:hypothetical protein